MRKQNSPLSVLCFLLAWIILGSSVSPYAEELRPTDSVMGDLLPNAVTAAEQTKNILYLAKATAQNIEQILPAQISFSSSSLSLAACAPCTDMPVSSYNSFSFLDPTLSGSRYTAELYLDCSKLSPGITGKKVFEYRFNTTAAAQTAFNALSIDYTLYSNNGSTSTRNQGLTLYKVFMGDINGDGAVNTADALMAQQAAVGKITLTETQALADDVDRDGDNDSSDSLAVLQYATGKIATFWDYTKISTSANPNIVSGKQYRIQNSFSKNYLGAKSDLSGASLGSLSSYQNGDQSMFTFTHLGSGLYIIRPYYNVTKCLSLSSDGKTLCFESFSNLPRFKWYIGGSGSSFYLVNASQQSKFLTCSGFNNNVPAAGYVMHNRLWNIHEREAYVINYFDNGMLTRWNTSSNQLSTDINSYMTMANEFYSYLGVSVKNISSNLYSSTADGCTGYSTNTALNNQCSHFSPFTTSQRSHKDNRYMLDDFISSCSRGKADIAIYWTGHYTWEDTTTTSGTLDYGQHKTNGGFAITRNNKKSIFMLNIGNNGTISSNFNYDNRIHHTVLHELGHSIAGLPDSYCNEKGGKQCTNKCCWRHGEENARPKDCLMANQEHEMSYYTNENLLCSVCKQDAIEYIKANF